MRDETRLWLQQAEEDLKTARINLDAERFYAVAQFAEQAAEKALKALHIDKTGELAPKSHDLKSLGQSVDAPNDLWPELQAMTKEYLVARYPDASPGIMPASAVDREKAEHDLDLAERVMRWVRAQLETRS